MLTLLMRGPGEALGRLVGGGDAGLAAAVGPGEALGTSSDAAVAALSASSLGAAFCLGVVEAAALEAARLGGEGLQRSKMQRGGAALEAAADGWAGGHEVHPSWTAAAHPSLHPCDIPSLHPTDTPCCQASQFHWGAGAGGALRFSRHRAAAPAPWKVVPFPLAPGGPASPSPCGYLLIIIIITIVFF